MKRADFYNFIILILCCGAFACTKSQNDWDETVSALIDKGAFSQADSLLDAVKRHASAEELRRADSLQETERQRREFIANISHELKTPMTTISGYAEGILDGTIPHNQEEHYLHIISDESRRLSRLVRRMLDVSQLQSIDLLKEKAPFDICESMRRALISLEKKITDRNLDVEADIPDEPTMVLGDKELITQVIYNLLENAAKFAREGSTLYLGVARMDGKALVSIRNEGDTIPAEELPLLFERLQSFFRVAILSLATSLLAETMQLILRVGCFDVDDLLLNTIGGCIGYCVYLLIRRYWRGKYGKKKL